MQHFKRLERVQEATPKGEIIIQGENTSMHDVVRQEVRDTTTSKCTSNSQDMESKEQDGDR
eukprot:6191153-Prorocentrum_lima.AAC.1